MVWMLLYNRNGGSSSEDPTSTSIRCRRFETALTGVMLAVIDDVGVIDGVSLLDADPASAPVAAVMCCMMPRRATLAKFRIFGVSMLLTNVDATCVEGIDVTIDAQLNHCFCRLCACSTRVHVSAIFFFPL